MNHREFSKLIQEVQIDPAKIIGLAHFCLKSTGHEPQITKRFQYYLHQQTRTIQFKLLILQVMSYIMVELNGRKFIRHFCVRIKSFLVKNSKQIARDDLLSQKVIELFNKWKDNKLFADSFIKILRETASSILGVEEIIKSSPFVKYSKSYLMAYQDVSRVSEAMAVYRTICDKTLLTNKIQELQKEFQKNQSEGNRTDHTTLLLKRCQTYIQQLIKIINSFQNTSKNLCLVVKQEAASLQISEEQLITTNDQ